tara:strand:- start:14285 stop:15511 length:1227 start_codon:yes stop_codon:yes gene_type:complete
MASDGTVVLQSVNRMFDRLFAEKRQRSLDALKMVELGLKDRQMTMMEEARGLQADQSRMQMAMVKIADMEKFTNVQKAKIANDFLVSSRFLDFYNPDNPEWAVDFTKALKGEYKQGFMGDEQGWKFSDRNASLIASSLIQAQAGNPDAVLTIIDRANKSYLTAESGQQLVSEDANLLTGFTNMGMFVVGQDEKGQVFVDKSPQWQSLTDATTNVLSNESKIAEERTGLQSGDYDIKEKLNFLKYETLPDIQKSLNELDMQKLLEQQMKDAYSEIPDNTSLETEKINIEGTITSTSDRLKQLSDGLATKQLDLKLMRDEQSSGYAFDKVAFETLNTDIDSVKASMDVLESELKTQNDLRIESSRKIELEERNIPITEKNIERLENEKQMTKMMAEWELSQMTNRPANKE